MKRSEAEVAEVVMEAMTAEGYDCYPEVELPGGGRADIVGIRDVPFSRRRITHIVEVKTSWTLSLLEQGERGQAVANYASIAAPTQPSGYYIRLAHRAGLGVIRFATSADLRVDPQAWGAREPRRIPHRYRRDRWGGRSMAARLVSSLHEDQKRFKPGTTAAGGYSTPWSRTMDQAAAYIRENPGATVSELIDSVDYHYSTIGSARQGFLTWLAQREDVEARQDGRLTRFYPPGAPSIRTDLFTTENET